MRTGIAAAGVWLALGATAQPQDVPPVTCRVEHDPAARVYTLDKEGDRWRLSFRSAETGEAWIRLALPGAAPRLVDGRVRLSYRNANGGRQIELVASARQSSLDVWVDHGLEVNIEPDLDPRVDLMTTGGPLAGVACSVGGSP